MVLCGNRHLLRPNYFNAQKIKYASGGRPDSTLRHFEAEAGL